MIFCILVHGDQASSDAPQSALQFAEASIELGHELNLIFFYHDAVEVARAIQQNDDPARSLMMSAWKQIGAARQTELAVCVSAASRRGLYEVGAAVETPARNLDPAFTVAGLGQLAAAMIEADRVITFAA